jgi:hypothetical protein
MKKWMLQFAVVLLLAISPNLLPHSFAQAATHANTLNWTASPTAGSTVNVYRAPGACSSSSVFSQLATGIVAAGPYVDSNPIPGPACYYVTSSFNGVESLASNKITLTSPVLPQPPTGLAGSSS